MIFIDFKFKLNYNDFQMNDYYSLQQLQEAWMTDDVINTLLLHHRKINRIGAFGKIFWIEQNRSRDRRDVVIRERK